MPVPDFNHVGLIPPFIGDSPAGPPSNMSPHKTDLLEVIEVLGLSSERRVLLRNLLEYRSELRRTGVSIVCQWLAGSFVEDIDKRRPPGDIDLVTFYYSKTAPLLSPEQQELFNRYEVKDRFVLDSFFIPVDNHQVFLKQTCYLLGLFSHRRDTFEWKGILQVPFSDDSAVKAKLEAIDAKQA